MAINDYSLAAMQQIAKLISDSSDKDREGIRDSLAYMSMAHGINMDKAKLDLAERGQISAEESQDFRDALSMLTFGAEQSFKDRQMDIMEEKMELAEDADERAKTEHLENIKNIRMERASKELTIMESVRALNYKKGVAAFYDDSGLMSLYSRYGRDIEDDEDRGQEDAVEELHKEWGFDINQAQNIVSAVWGYNDLEQKDPSIIGSIANKVNASLKRVAAGESTNEDDKYVQAFQTSGYINPTDEASLNSVMDQTNFIIRAGAMESLISAEMEQIAKGDYELSPEIGMYTSAAAPRSEEVDLAGGPIPMQFEVGQRYDVQQLKDWELETNIKNQLSDKSFVEFGIDMKNPSQAEVISYTPPIAGKKTDKSGLKEAFTQLELFSNKLNNYVEQDYNPIRKELHEAFTYLKGESDLQEFLPTRTEYGSGRGYTLASDRQVLDPFGIPTEDDLRKLSAEAAKLSERPWRPSLMKRWNRPIGVDIIKATEDYKSALNKFKDVQAGLDQLKRMESDARANVSRIYSQSWQP